MKNAVLKAGNEQDFFRRGRALAGLADAGQPLPEGRTVSFEDPADLLSLLTARRLDGFRSVNGTAELESLAAPSRLLTGIKPDVSKSGRQPV